VPRVAARVSPETRAFFILEEFPKIAETMVHMVILDGKQLQQKLMEGMKTSYSKLPYSTHLGIVVVGDNAASELFIKKKIAFGKRIGVQVHVYREAGDISTVELCKVVVRVATDTAVQGMVVQLPLPEHIDTKEVLNSIPQEKDVDMLSASAIKYYTQGGSVIAPPVIGAIEAFIKEYQLDVNKKHLVIIGEGKLVGRPAVLWAEKNNQEFTIIPEETKKLSEIVMTGDIIISGVGKANMITGDMVKDGVIIFDAGISTGESKGVTGDIDFDSVSKKASFITPVPGGIGPVTVAIIFQNLLKLIAQRQ